MTRAVPQDPEQWIALWHATDLTIPELADRAHVTVRAIREVHRGHGTHEARDHLLEFYGRRLTDDEYDQALTDPDHIHRAPKRPDQGPPDQGPPDEKQEERTPPDDEPDERTPADDKKPAGRSGGRRARGSGASAAPTPTDQSKEAASPGKRWDAVVPGDAARLTFLREEVKKRKNLTVMDIVRELGSNTSQVFGIHSGRASGRQSGLHARVVDWYRDKLGREFVDRVMAAPPPEVEQRSRTKRKDTLSGAIMTEVRDGRSQKEITARTHVSKSTYNRWQQFGVRPDQEEDAVAAITALVPENRAERVIERLRRAVRIDALDATEKSKPDPALGDVDR